MTYIPLPDKKKISEGKLIYEQAIKGMGFTPTSLHMMSHKPNILGSFSLLFANIRGYSGAKVSTWMGIRLFFKNLGWTIRAKKNPQNEVPIYLKNLVAHVTSNAAGCRYCQAHTAYEAHHNGVSAEKLEKIWEFQTSDLFTEAEKAALNFGFAAGSVPNQVTETHFEELKKHYSPEQIVELTSVIAVFGFLNRWNDTMGTTLEEDPLNFAQNHLSKAGWEAGKHQS